MILKINAKYDGSFWLDANNILQKSREKYWTINASYISGSFESFARWEGGRGDSHLHRHFIDKNTMEGVKGL